MHKRAEMKLLYVLGSYYPAQSGGPNNTIHWQAKYLSKRGHNVEVAALKDGLTAEHLKRYNIRHGQKKNIEGVTAYYFDYLIHRILCFSLYIWLFNNVKRFELVQLTSYFFPVSWVAAFICILKGVPFSIAPRGELEPAARQYNGKMKKRLYNLFLCSLMNSAKFVLVTSEQEKEYSKPFFRPVMPFEMLANYIEIPDTEPAKPHKREHILSVGRIHPKKAIENLIEAYSKLTPEQAEKHNLIIAGRGDEAYTEKLLALKDASPYADKIRFVGHVEGTRKMELYAGAKMFVLASHSENFGNVVVEALSTGCPVIASTNTPWKELNNYFAGAWSDNDPDKLLESMNFVLELDKDKYPQMCNNAYNLAQKYSVTKHINVIEDVYERNCQS